MPNVASILGEIILLPLLTEVVRVMFTCIRCFYLKKNTLVPHQKKALIDEHKRLYWIWAGSGISVFDTKKTPLLLFLQLQCTPYRQSGGSMHTLRNTTIVAIPGGCTPVLQPLDVSINKPVKVINRNLWEEYMLEQSDNDSGTILSPSNSTLSIGSKLQSARSIPIRAL